MDQLPGCQLPDALGVEKGNPREVDDERLVGARYVPQGVTQIPEIPEVELAPDLDASPHDAYPSGFGLVFGGRATTVLWNLCASFQNWVCYWDIF